jgi:hypothetical protein
VRTEPIWRRLLAHGREADRSARATCVSLFASSNLDPTTSPIRLTGWTARSAAAKRRLSGRKRILREYELRPARKRVGIANDRAPALRRGNLKGGKRSHRHLAASRPPERADLDGLRQAVRRAGPASN